MIWPPTKPGPEIVRAHTSFFDIVSRNIFWACRALKWKENEEQDHDDDEQADEAFVKKKVSLE